MKLQLSTTQNRRGTSITEMAVTIGILGLLGGVFFDVLNSGLILFAKNAAVNVSHEEARQALNRLTRDIHSAVSVPQLRGIDAAYLNTAGNIPFSKFPVISSNPVAGVAPTAAGVSFQNIAGGPNYVWKDTPNNKIMIKDGTAVKFKATEGMRLIVPLWGLEEDITKRTSEGPHSNVWTTTDETTPSIPNAPEFGGTSTYAITFYTDRVAYMVKNGKYVADTAGPFILSGSTYVPYTSGTMQRYRYEGGELHFYKQRYTGGSGFFWEDQAVVARNISSPKPFYIPLNSNGGVNNKYVGIKLTARDIKSSNRKFQATATLLDTQVDYRSRICLYQ